MFQLRSSSPTNINVCVLLVHVQDRKSNGLKVFPFPMSCAIDDSMMACNFSSVNRAYKRVFGVPGPNPKSWATPVTVSTVISLEWTNPKS